MRWQPQHSSPELLLEREWIVTNGLGGYASTTVAGALTRKYHGLLVAALPPPLGRTVMWSHLDEELSFSDGHEVLLGEPEQLVEFRLENGLPVWSWSVGDLLLEKRVLMPHLQNTVLVSYTARGGGELPALRLRPAFHFRHHESPVDAPLHSRYRATDVANGTEISGGDAALPPLRLKLCGVPPALAAAEAHTRDVLYPVEKERGYEWQGQLWSPGYFSIPLDAQQTVTLIGSTEDWPTIHAIEPDQTAAAELQRRERLLSNAPPAAREGIAAELVLAADQFIIRPAGRPKHEEARTVIAGYHWFTDWGRDTMIALEGLTLCTGRAAEAGYILRTFAEYVRDGLIPNMFPDGKSEGLYHTADATLWFFHALHRYVSQTGDRETLQSLLPKLVDIAEQHLRGTKFNIHVDPDDALLVQGAEGYQLTWMDAKMGDWVVTPRRGKAVELNALWYNALQLLATWLRESGDTAAASRFQEQANCTRVSFNHRFWYADGGYLYDVIDCDGTRGAVDTACRPNQLFAISLDHPVLDEQHWSSVVAAAERHLLTPVGLRSLAPDHPEYQPIYGGDLRSRDGAYHQGTVWGWLIAPFVDAWLKVHPGEHEQARQFLTGFEEHMNEAGIGTISEVFHGREPHTAGGCIAQAWSVAEALRCWLRTDAPGG
jgi:predicted glycogen debranching enzyme